MNPQTQKDPSFIVTSLWALAIVAGVAVAVTAGWQLAGPGELRRQLAQAENDLRASQAEVARLKKELTQKPAFSSPQNSSSSHESGVAASSHAGEKSVARTNRQSSAEAYSRASASASVKASSNVEARQIVIRSS